MKAPLDDPDLEALLAAERAAPDPSSAVQDRVWQRVAASAAAPLVLGGTASPSGAAAAGSAAVKGGLALKLGLTAGLLAGGAGVLVATRTPQVTQAAHPAPERTGPERSTTPKRSTTLERTGPSAERARDPIEGSAVEQAPAAPESTAPAQDTTLAAERALLVTATRALRRGDLAAAGAALDQHAHAFAQGRLEEERLVLSIRLLRAQGQTADAERATQHFRNRFPHSLLTGALTPPPAAHFP